MSPVPATVADWEAEVEADLQAALAEAEGQGLSDADLWHFIEDRAVAGARRRRGLPPLAAADLDRLMDAITECTLRLRRAAAGDPDDHHIDEYQFYLLYYVAAHVHAGLIAEDAAGRVVAACWDDPEEEGAAGGGDERDLGDEAWEIRRPPPATPGAWLDEILSAWRLRFAPPPLRCADGAPLLADRDDLRELAVILALVQRGCAPAAHSVRGLIGVIAEMETDIARLGPELTELKRVDPLAFTLYYLWTHIVIGRAGEEAALQVVALAAERVGEFDRRPRPTGKSGTSAIRRRLRN